MALDLCKFLLRVLGEHTMSITANGLGSPRQDDRIGPRTTAVEYRLLKKPAAQAPAERAKRSVVTSPRRPGLLPWMLAALALLTALFGLRAIGRRNVAVGIEDRAPHVGAAAPQVAPERILVKLPNGASLIAEHDSPTLGLAQYLADPNDRAVPRTFTWSESSLPVGAKPTPEATATLESIATVLQAYPTTRARIVSHTAIRGDPAINRRTSMNESLAIKRMLMTRGIDASRIEPVGAGGDHPLLPNDSDENRARNQRIELVVTRK